MLVAGNNAYYVNGRLKINERTCTAKLYEHCVVNHSAGSPDEINKAKVAVNFLLAIPCIQVQSVAKVFVLRIFNFHPMIAIILFHIMKSCSVRL